MKSLDDMTEPELRDLFNRVARAIDGMLPDGTGFVLIAAPFGPEGVGQYVANGDREDCIRWMRETADRLDGREDVPR